MSNRKQARLEAKRFIDTLSVEPYPNSQKSYLLALALIFGCLSEKLLSAILWSVAVKMHPSLSPMSLSVCMTHLASILTLHMILISTRGFLSSERSGLKSVEIRTFCLV